MKKFFLVGGGTGGHCIPMSVLYSEIIKENECYILTDERGQQYFKDISVKKKILIKNLINKQGKISNLINLPYIFIQSIPYFLRLRPDFVLGFGGYFTVPIIIAGWLMRFKIFLHEGNAIIGKANRFLLNFTKDLLTSFENTLISGKKININNKMVGLPIRINKDDKVLNNNSSNDFVISVIGGSQGAHNLSINIAESIKSVQDNSEKRIIVYHQCRSEDLERLQAYYQTHNINNDVRVFFDEMAQVLSKSNLVISRSGSSTVNEIIYYCIPSILIPYPHASDNHQYYNAKNLNTSECTKIISNDSVNLENIINSINEIMNDNERVNLIKNRLKSRRIINPSKNIIDYLESHS
ncbi:UDP-N-acetylglucosamine--N-acetylmuramyl-(pentapeptide) pyrophosphoryl-undecaprenol N-acetylglucosamine transferase [Pelagibacteraceae bacterium]|nr:UDP-N-acetylglucosamine--N-acetylmuramyl-(pentapeptide) pyrophosphoryl-undecaprenol N-acetylglucosamine transferase [Pelagibacteraceae bacterium]